MKTVDCQWRPYIGYKLQFLCSACGVVIDSNVLDIELTEREEGVFKTKCPNQDCNCQLKLNIKDFRKEPEYSPELIQLLGGSEPFPAEFSEIVDEHFWELLM